MPIYPMVFTSPPTIPTTSQEILPVGIDFTNNLGLGDSIQSAASILLDTSMNTAFPGGLAGSPTVSGNIVTQRVTGLTAEHNYILAITIVITPSTLQLSSAVNLQVPY